MSKVEIGASLKKVKIEFGMLCANSRTVHFFRFKPMKQHRNSELSNLDMSIDEIQQKGNGAFTPSAPQESSNSFQEEEETKIGSFFKRMKDKMLPVSLTHEKSNLRIYMDRKLTEDHPYIIFPSNNSTLIVSLHICNNFLL